MTEREFETLVREHRSTIYTVCYMFSTDKDEVADLFQEILINLWRGSGTFRGESALNSWIWKVALNTCISQDRKKRRGLRTEPLSMDIGLVVGLILGLKNRRDILDASDDLLAQIEELKG